MGETYKLLLFLTIFGAQPRSGTLTLDPVVTGRRHATVHDSPDFLGQILGELSRVSDDDDTTFKRLDGL